MNAAGSKIKLVNFSRHCTKQYRTAVMNNSAQIHFPTGLSAEWTEIKILVAGLFVCGISLIVNSWPF